MCEQMTQECDRQDENLQTFIQVGKINSCKILRGLTHAS